MVTSITNSLPEDLSSEQLLELYLKLPAKERSARFADTAHCAEVVGVSQRTILVWIDSGMIRAIPALRKEFRESRDFDDVRERHERQALEINNRSTSALKWRVI